MCSRGSEEASELEVAGGKGRVVAGDGSWRPCGPFKAPRFTLDEMRSHWDSEQGLTWSLTFLNVHPDRFVETRLLEARAEQGTSRRLLQWSQGKKNSGLN